MGIHASKFRHKNNIPILYIPCTYSIVDACEFGKEQENTLETKNKTMKTGHGLGRVCMVLLVLFFQSPTCACKHGGRRIHLT